MAIRLLEGFELDRNATYLGYRTEALAGTVTFSTSGRTHGFSASGPASGGPLWRYDQLSAALLDEWVIGFGYRCSAAIAAGSQTNWTGVSLTDGNAVGNTQIMLYAERVDDETVRWNLRRGDSVSTGASLGTSTPFNPKVWHYFELKVDVRTGVNGSATLKMHDIYGTETTILTVSGVDTAYQGTDGADRFGMQIRSYPAHTAHFDDLYVLDTAAGTHTDFLGPIIIESSHPEADGTYSEWSPDPSGSHAGNVRDSETIPTLTDWVEDDGASSPQSRDLYTYDDLAIAKGDVVALNLQTICQVDAASSGSFHHFLRNAAGTENDGITNTTNSTTPVMFSEILDQDPVTAAAWDSDDIDAYEFGVERE